MSLAWHVRLAGQAEQDLLDITLGRLRISVRGKPSYTPKPLLWRFRLCMTGKKFWDPKCGTKLVRGFEPYMWRGKAEKDAISWPSQYLKDTSSMYFDYCMTAWIWPGIFRKTTMNRIGVDQFNLACI